MHVFLSDLVLKGIHFFFFSSKIVLQFGWLVPYYVKKKKDLHLFNADKTLKQPVISVDFNTYLT